MVSPKRSLRDRNLGDPPAPPLLIAAYFGSLRLIATYCGLLWLSLRDRNLGDPPAPPTTEPRQRRRASASSSRAQEKRQPGEPLRLPPKARETPPHPHPPPVP